jgi:hypothetical protein
MPRDRLAITRQLAEEMGPPTDKSITQQVSDDLGDLRVTQKVVHPAMPLMGRTDGILVVSLSQHARK